VCACNQDFVSGFHAASMLRFLMNFFNFPVAVIVDDSAELCLAVVAEAGPRGSAAARGGDV